MKFGSKDIPFVYKGDKLVYPNPIKDGLLLWYDFKGMRNTDVGKEVAKDLSGNGNDGTLTNFNFTEGSGYKDNTLVFDGVDDRLIIPELELDETAMTVMQDGKIYAYEDDKVVTVGEDGEIIGGNKNIFNLGVLPNHSKFMEITKTADIFEITGEPIYHGVKLSNDSPNIVLDTVSIPPGETLTSSIFIKNGIDNSLTNNLTSLVFYDTVAKKTLSNTSNNTINKWVRLSVTYENNSTEIMNAGIYFYLSRAEGNITYFTSPKLEFGNNDTVYSPPISNYKSSTLSPASLTDLQLYNKTLNKDELLHNAGSKGLNKLKPGVVVQDGLVLHYDFSHESNTSEYKGKAFDYSGNGNHGELQNFNFTEESGYVSEGLKFDGVDDYIGESVSRIVLLDSYQETISFVAKVNENKRNNILYAQENLKIDLRGNSLSRADVTPSISLSYDFLDKIVSVIMVKTETNIKTFINGELLGDASITNSSSTQLSSIGYYIPNGRPNINLYDVKIYNRTLSPEEIAHNYAIEKEKFDIIEGEM